jgi:hypothetical protein
VRGHRRQPYLQALDAPAARPDGAGRQARGEAASPRPAACSTSNGPWPRSMTSVTAGYGTTGRSTRSLARSLNPAILTPAIRPSRDGTAMSHTAAAS